MGMTEKCMSDPLWERADNRFFWNKECVHDLIACKADEWIVPFMSAFVEFQPNCEVEGKTFSILFISRRSRHRAGCRFTKRGIDESGNVANFVETEQILLFADGKVTSYVQIRGSIPIIWHSPVHMKYAPLVYIHDNRTRLIEACEKHVNGLLKHYADENSRTGVIFVNLIDNKKEQGRLGRVFKEVVDGVQETRKQDILKYIWFDFHHETKGMKYHHLSKLVLQIDEEFRKQNYFCKLGRKEGGRVIR